jgi:hypothetical protein
MAEIIGNAEEAPSQLSMDGPGLMVYQETSQCCRCCCCQPNINWTIHDYADNWSHESELPTKAYMKEDASWFGRCWSHCWPGWRATTYTVHAGSSDAGTILFKHEKSATCSNCPLYPPFYGDNGPIRCPWCCCLPYLETKDPNGNLLGTSKYVCDECIFIPKYEVLDKNGTRVFFVRPEVCFGCCVQCRGCGDNGGGGGGKGKCFRVPFLIRQPLPPYDQVDAGSITDLWAGMKHECCTNREMYSITWPTSMSNSIKDVDAIKKTLIGMTLLIDITCNEQDQ